MDISVVMGHKDGNLLAELLEGEFMLSRGEIMEALESTDPYRCFQLMHLDTTFKFDMFVRHSSEYDGFVVSRAVRLEILPGVIAPVISAEDIIIQKLRWYELGNRVSDRQWNDVVQVLEVQKGLLDEAYLDRWSTHFGVSGLLDKARDQAFD